MVRREVGAASRVTSTRLGEWKQKNSDFVSRKFPSYALFFAPPIIFVLIVLPPGSTLYPPSGNNPGIILLLYYK